MAVPALCVVEFPGSTRARGVFAAEGGVSASVGAVDRVIRRSDAGRGRRRRIVGRTVVACGVAAVVALLSLPLAITGGSPSTPALAAGPGLHGVAPSTVYVVQDGDTLWSIAARFDSGGDVRPFVEALSRQIGSSVVVPGERITIP